MTRIRRRRHDIGSRSPASSLAQYRIKAGAKVIPRDKDKRPYPSRLRGFLIVHNNKTNKPEIPGVPFLIAWDEMAAFGFDDREAIKKAVVANWKADDDALPKTLQFAIVNDAVMNTTTGEWEFGNTLQEEYACYNREGLLCHGDGETAYRKQDAKDKSAESESGRKKIDCCPVGALGVSEEEACPFSVKGECKSHTRLVVHLLDPTYDRPYPLGGITATYQLDTTSEYGASRFFAALEDAANRLNGRISGIFGDLRLQIVDKKNPGGGAVPTPQLTITLNSAQIAERERELAGRFLDGGSAPAVMIGAPEHQHRRIGPPIEPLSDAVEFSEEEPEPIEATTSQADAQAESQESSDDLPDDAEPANVMETAPGPVPVVDATDEEIADALQFWIGVQAEENDFDPKEVCANLLHFQHGEKDVRPSFASTCLKKPEAEAGQKARANMRAVAADLESKTEFVVTRKAVAK